MIPKSVHRHLNTHLWPLYSTATRRQRITEGIYKLNYVKRIGGGFSPVDAKLAICWDGPTVNTHILQLSFGQSCNEQKGAGRTTEDIRETHFH
jgi:hypothetical protein